MKRGRPQENLKIKTTKDPNTGEIVTDESKVANVFADYFDANQNKDEFESIGDTKPSIAPTTERTIIQFRTSETRLDEVFESIKTSDTRDPYGITTRLIKLAYPKIKKQLLKIINRSFLEARVPNNIRKIWITPIPKKGKADEPKNTRPINLTSILLKRISNS